MLRGTIHITTDQNEALQMSLNNGKIVCISNEFNNYPEFVNATGACIGSILTPPYECLSYEIDGDLIAFKQSYLNYLNTKECINFIAVMLRSVYNGTNIVLYLTPDEATMAYSRVLLEYLFGSFGIVVGQYGVPFSYNAAMGMNLYELFMSFDIMTPGEFLAEWYNFMNYNPSDLTLTKLIYHDNPYVVRPDGLPPTLEDFRNYYRYAMMNARGQVQEMPVTVAGC